MIFETVSPDNLKLALGRKSLIFGSVELLRILRPFAVSVEVLIAKFISVIIARIVMAGVWNRSIINERERFFFDTFHMIIAALE